MKKIKKTYCAASFIFACAVLVFTIGFTFCSPKTTYAQSVNGEDVTDLTQGGGETADHDDNTNGLSITYIDTNSYAFDAYDIIFGTFDSYYADFIYKNYYCSSLFEDSDRNTDSTTKPGVDWIGVVFDFLYYVANISAGK